MVIILFNIELLCRYILSVSNDKGLCHAWCE